MGTITRISTAGMSREDWLAERRHSLGGSDMGAILGLNLYRSPYAVWAEKTGRLPEPEDNEAMRVGRDLEDYVLSRFCDISGKTTHHVNAILRNSDYPHIHANVDSKVENENAGVEAKTVSALGASKYAGGEFPASYYAQCVTYLAVTGYDRWYLAALIMGREFKVYMMTRIENDPCPDFCEASVYVPQSELDGVRDAAIEFWKHVDNDTPPEVDGMESTTKAITALHPLDDGTEIDLTAVIPYIREYIRLKEQQKDLESALADAANHIKEFMGESTKGRCELAGVSWKAQDRRTLDTKALLADYPGIKLDKYYNTSTSRVFKLTAAKN